MSLRIHDLRRLKIKGSSLIFGALALSFAFGLSACGTDSFVPKTADEGALTPQSSPGDNLSEEDRKAQSVILTDEGEALTSPETLDQATMKFREALQLDPSNVRADFWLHLVGPFMEFKGLLLRVKPLYETLPEGRLKYNEFLTESTSNMTPEIQSFLLQGAADIDDLDKFQEWIDRILMRLSDLRAFIEKNKNETIRIRTPAFLTHFEDDGSYSFGLTSRCRATTSSGNSIQLPGCFDQTAVSEVTLNRADFEMLKYSVSPLEMFITMLNAYRLSPLEMKKLNLQKDNPATVAHVIGSILSKGGSIPLRSSNRLPRILDQGRDMLIATQYFSRNHAVLCPRGLREGQMVRSGHLFPKKICGFGGDKSQLSNTEARKIEEQRKALLMFETVIAGSPIDFKFRTGINDREEGYMMQFDIRKFLESPLDDLNKLAPMKVNSCSFPVAVNDQVVRDYFPQGNFNEALGKHEYATMTCESKAGAQ